jgi:hypothetical protein
VGKLRKPSSNPKFVYSSERVLAARNGSVFRVFAPSSVGVGYCASMSDRAAPEPLRMTRHLVALCSLGVLLGLVTFVLPRATLAPLGALLGLAAAFVLAQFAVYRYRQARRFVWIRTRPTPGRIVEYSEPGRMTFEFPADGLEPWFSDAWVLGVTALAAWVISGVTGRGLSYGFLALLIFAVAARLWSSQNDRLRIELRADGFTMDCSEGGRTHSRVGPGPLLPELQPDALTLWSTAGRVGVLRGELLPEERAWLAERLAGFAEQEASGARETEEQVNERNTGQDRKSEQAEHTK